ncbi:MAG TPA: hypothetical protein VE861_12145, partial [Gemmatimonadaceae bacterium]|nr:hypothetical protein [Gemmatimonadaceae bacterium]
MPNSVQSPSLAPSLPVLSLVPEVSVPRKTTRGSTTGSGDARAAAEALAASREQERQFVLAAQEGDTAAFAQLVRRHQQRAYAVARAVLLSHEDAEDA